MGKIILVCVFILFNVPFVYDMINGTAWDPYFQDHNMLRLSLGYYILSIFDLIAIGLVVFLFVIANWNTPLKDYNKSITIFKEMFN